MDNANRNRLPTSSIHRWCLNAFIGAIVVVVVIDTLPQTPPALHRAIEPTLIRLGINQGPWNLFGPDPDGTNMRLRAEITYRDGERREWEAPDWAAASPWKKWVGHRHFEWHDHIVNQKHARVLEPWCRHIARAARPDFPNADQGAEVRIICQEASVPPADERPWKRLDEPPQYGDGWVLTIEQLE